MYVKKIVEIEDLLDKILVMMEIGILMTAVIGSVIKSLDTLVLEVVLHTKLCALRYVVMEYKWSGTNVMMEIK